MGYKLKNCSHFQNTKFIRKVIQNFVLKHYTSFSKIEILNVSLKFFIARFKNKIL